MSGVKQHNEESATLGSWFKSAREQRGESLENVSAVTRIGKNYLQAIEEDHLEKLPSPAYTKGFIRLYAKHLGLSAEEAFQQIEHGTTRKVEDPEISAPTPTKNYSPGRTTPSGGLRKWSISIFLLLALSLLAVLPALKQGKDNTPGSEKAPPQQSASTQNPAPATTPLQQPSDVKPPDTGEDKPAAREELPADTGIILRLKAVQDGRIHITIDGAVSQEYDLKNGDVIEWKAEKIFLLELDNAGSVEGELNGKRMKAFGETGKAAHLTIRADSVN